MDNEEKILTSPLPQEAHQPVQYLFWDALKATLDGKKIRKLEWEDDSIYCALVDEKLCIRMPDQKFHAWQLQAADMLGDDWVIIE
jgi:hypothetical protein